MIFPDSRVRLLHRRRDGHNAWTEYCHLYWEKSGIRQNMDFKMHTLQNCSDVKRGQYLEVEAKAEAKNNYEKVPNND